jgi:hypothetical protein
VNIAPNKIGLTAVRQEIERACRDAKRDPASVTRLWSALVRLGIARQPAEPLCIGLGIIRAGSYAGAASYPVNSSPVLMFGYLARLFSYSAIGAKATPNIQPMSSFASKRLTDSPGSLPRS